MKMREMVELVARSICMSRAPNLPPDGWEPAGWIVRYADEHWKLFIVDARLAIQTMREPTAAMVASCPDEDAGLIWRDMIDEALK